MLLRFDGTTIERADHAPLAPGFADALVSPSRSWYVASKMVAELVFAFILLLVSAPLVFLAALLIKLTSRGPVLYTQTRVGQYGQPYTIYKLRTMRHRCESLSGAQWATTCDPRVTPVGGFLRKTHLDELPQLWNVLRGEMSIVGPRPERPEFVPELERVIPGYRQRLLVRPGVTGLAQVQLPADIDVEGVRRKLAYDLYYIFRQNAGLELRILFGTALKVFGVPFWFLRTVFRMPSEDDVEDVYQSLINPEFLTPRMQPA
jgi:lipopolysaccharide/colanic/teichoic acid biosynthesis glycosyltransferase